MVERGLYYATADFAQMIKNNGGIWNDTKHRPIVCLIKYKNLISELERKLFRILSVENTKNNSFRQHITDVKHFLLQELESDKQQNA